MPRLLGMLAVLALLLAGVSSAKDVAWRKLRSEHFEIYTADSDKTARRVLEHLERVRAAFQMLTNSKTQAARPVRVVLFRGKREYEPFSLPGFSDAYYMSARGRDHIVLSDFAEDAERVLNHEYFHLFSKNAGFDLPVWLEEGLADYFSTLRITAKDVSVGWPIVSHLQYLNSFAGNPAPSSQMFTVTRSNRHQADYRSTLLLYAQGWALTHMTFLSQEMRPKSGEFFQAMRNSGDARQAYREVYGLTPEALDQQLAGYINRRSYQYLKQPAKGLDFAVRVEPQSMEDWEAPLLLAELQTYVRRSEQARASFDALARRFPQVPEIDEAQGYLAILDMDRTRAKDSFREAARKGSANGEVYFRLATLDCDYNAYRPQCRDWINTSLRLDPGNREARRWASGYLLNARKFEEALATMMESAELRAADAPEFFRQFAYAQANLGRIDEARVALKRGLSYAKTPQQIAQLQELEKLVEGSAEYRQQIDNLKTGAVRGVGQRVAGDEAAGDTIDAALEVFLETEGNHVVSGTLQSVECGALKTLVVAATGQVLRLTIEKDVGVTTFRAGATAQTPELLCGAQSPLRVMAGYHRDGAPEGSDGWLRILSFP
ncbi:MAG: hypothetical protein KIT83_13790 [Bryobacterales bacterium]|nr:hypothetical protein [Bryobacterales bacterium]